MSRKLYRGGQTPTVDKFTERNREKLAPRVGEQPQQVNQKDNDGIDWWRHGTKPPHNDLDETEPELEVRSILPECYHIEPTEHLAPES